MLLCGAASVAVADEVSCGRLDIGAYGANPIDYRAPPRIENLNVVEQYHFTADVEGLRRPKSGFSVGQDLDYTLRAVPNHHRALAAMMNLAIRDKTERPVGSNFAVDCWFDRALRHTPNDATVMMLWGTYKARRGNKAEALEMLKKADELGASNANLHYNLGLVYADLGKWDESMAYAAKAYAAGFNLPGLQRKLTAAKAWRPELVEREKAAMDGDPPAETSAPTASASQSQAPVR